MIRKSKIKPGEDATDDVLGDISVNAFGLVMIILLVCIILFSNITGASQKESVSQEPPSSSASHSDLTIGKRLRLSTLEQQVSEVKKRNALVGMWALRIHVTRLVSMHSVEASDEFVEYYIWIKCKDQRVVGTLFGAKRDGKPCMNFAKLVGTFHKEELELEFQFSGQATGSSEIANLRLEKGRLVGKLVSGKLQYGFSNFEGPVEGRRINGSLFEKTKL